MGERRFIPICQVAIPYKSGKYSYKKLVYSLDIKDFFPSQSLINQGNILTLELNSVCEDIIVESQSLINQGNILTKPFKRLHQYGNTEVAIPYKSGKYSYSKRKNNAGNWV